jgi:hypothetical protein
MFATSLAKLRTDHIDLFHLHYPQCWGDLCKGIADRYTIRSSGPASFKVTWILATSFPVSFNEAGPEDLIVSIRNKR